MLNSESVQVCLSGEGGDMTDSGNKIDKPYVFEGPNGKQTETKII